MTNALRQLLEKARAIKMSSEEREEQRQSFAYGNTHIENPDITKDTVREQAKTLKR